MIYVSCFTATVTQPFRLKLKDSRNRPRIFIQGQAQDLPSMMKCANPSCTYRQHSDVANWYHNKYCCYRCYEWHADPKCYGKNAKLHGPHCEKLPWEKEDQKAESKASKRKSALRTPRGNEEDGEFRKRTEGIKRVKECLDERKAKRASSSDPIDHDLHQQSTMPCTELSLM